MNEGQKGQEWMQRILARCVYWDSQVLERDGKLSELDQRTDALQVQLYVHCTVYSVHCTVYTVQCTYTQPLTHDETIQCEYVQEGASMFQKNAKTLETKKRCNFHKIFMFSLKPGLRTGS